MGLDNIKIERTTHKGLSFHGINSTRNLMSGSEARAIGNSFF